jgi:hypothetical protein
MARVPRLEPCSGTKKGFAGFARPIPGCFETACPDRPRPLYLDYQIVICSATVRIIGASAGQLNAAANAGKLASGPSTR